jgi:hypothetical protein
MCLRRRTLWPGAALAEGDGRPTAFEAVGRSGTRHDRKALPCVASERAL